MNIVLCGMMGCGKTTVAQQLAKLYGYKLIDTDSEIVARYGAIDKIFAEKGEEWFRDAESKITEEVAQKNTCTVISLGGGCVLRQSNVQALKKSGTIFYLRTQADTIIKRLKGDKTRPLLQGGLEERVRSILSARAKIYEQAADKIIDTDGLTPEQLAKAIKESLV